METESLPTATSSRNRIFSLATLLIANLVTLAFYVTGHASVIQVLWTYWLQSIAIGLIHVIRILGVTINLPAQATAFRSLIPSNKVINYVLAGFFIFQYGFFHLIYAVFIWAFSNPATVINGGPTPFLGADREINSSTLFLGFLAFLLHHGLTYLSERITNTAPQTMELKDIFSGPYRRIIPMHLTIIIAPIAMQFGGGKSVIIILIVLKTIVDLASQHIASNTRQASSSPTIALPDNPYKG